MPVVPVVVAAPFSGDPARALLEVVAESSPETLASLGLRGHEDEVVDLSPGADERLEARLLDLENRLAEARRLEKDPERLLDLELVLRAASLQRRQSAVSRRTFAAHGDAGKIVFTGLRPFLGPGKHVWHAERRLAEYVGFPDRPSVFARMQQRTTESLKTPGLLPPTQAEVLDEITHLDVYVDEIAKLVQPYEASGLRFHVATLRNEAAIYSRYLHDELLPRARTDFRLPPETYALLLERTGVTEAPRAFAARARAAYAKTRLEMEALAPAVAAQKKLRVKGAVAVLGALKREQREGDALVSLYAERLGQIESILRRENLVDVPETPVRMRLATPGETAQNPTPTLDANALFDPNAALDFVFPAAGISKPGEDPSARAYTDFTYDAASWVIAAHEARPGHELQFTTLKAKGLGLSRTLFAFTAANVEGWGLYAERLVFPYLPADGQLVALQMRALREARAFLDPGLHGGSVTQEQARAVLRDELGFSPGVVNQELDRYTYEDPAQATAYFFGFEALWLLRQDIERELGARFDPRAFHRAVLAAGLLPPDLLRASVRTQLRL